MPKIETGLMLALHPSGRNALDGRRRYTSNSVCARRGCPARDVESKVYIPHRYSSHGEATNQSTQESNFLDQIFVDRARRLACDGHLSAHRAYPFSTNDVVRVTGKSVVSIALAGLASDRISTYRAPTFVKRLNKSRLLLHLELVA